LVDRRVDFSPSISNPLDEVNMSTTLTLTLPESVYQQMQARANAIARPVEELAADLIAAGVQDGAPPVLSVPDPDVERERVAYLKLHPFLLRAYPNEFVAVLDGKMIDHDTEEDDLMRRVEEKYPDHFVWVSQVLAEPIPVFYAPSMRLDSATEP